MPTSPCFLSRSIRLVVVVVLFVGTSGSVGVAADPPGKLDAPEAIFAAVRAAARSGDVKAYKQLHLSKTDDLVLWILDRPHKLDPKLVAILEGDFLSGKEYYRDEIQTWVARRGRSFETAIVDDFYAMQLEKLAQELVRPGTSPADEHAVQLVKMESKDGMYARVQIARGGRPQFSLNVCRVEENRWKLDKFAAFSIATVLATFEQHKRAAARRQRLRSAVPSPSPPGAPAPGRR